MSGKERTPSEVYQYQDILVVGEQVGRIMHQHCIAMEQDDANRLRLVEALEINDPQLFHTMQSMINGFSMKGAESEAFCEGFVASYTALAAQAEITGKALPELTEEVGVGFIYDLEEVGDDYIDYLNATLTEMGDKNPFLLTCLVEYLVGHSDVTAEEQEAYRTGLVLAHDIIAQQVNANELVRIRSADAN